MGLIVQKFGGSSVRDAERVMNVAQIVTDTYRAGNDVVVVVSAQGDTTYDLIEKAYEIPRPVPKVQTPNVAEELAVAPVSGISGGHEDTITIDPNNPESIPIPKLLNSYVICEKGIYSLGNTFSIKDFH